ncbi:hypothetical protein PV327_003591 [Microctonus hyperodae]|uniref:NAD(P)H oxidase (H2O2-forming) n=1 Tax=Microctonus hyperodae TaxID=165561 RepID=A0AA39L119_MICHY|nr:hypothetical protein PV327_003591 [Microctonus hyperodae]
MLLIQIFLIINILISAQDNHDNGKNENGYGEVDKNKNIDDNEKINNDNNDDEDNNKDDEIVTTPTLPPTTTLPPIISRMKIDRMTPVYNLIDNPKINPFFVRPTEYPGYDGWYNNIGRPDLGAVDTPLLRRWPADYEDNVGQPSGAKRLDPLLLSDLIFTDSDVNDMRTYTGKNVLMVFFGQHVAAEILDSRRPACPPEYFNIKIPENHPYRIKTGQKEMPVLRTRYDEETGHSPNNPRQQLNEATPYLDGGSIYGTKKVWSDYLRTYSNGTFDHNGMLAHSDDRQYPERNKIRLPMENPPPPIHHKEYINRHYTENVERFYMLGNPRGNENPFVLALSIIWFRWHNVLAEQFAKRYPGWSDDIVYNEARKWVIATQQQIVVYDWLPQFIGKNLSDYEGYDASIDPQIDQFFQSAAFRFGHTLVPSIVYLRNYSEDGCDLKFDNNAIRLCNNYWMPENRLFLKLKKINEEIDVERLIMGMSMQLAGSEDQRIVDDLRTNLYGPLEFSRRDLVALNIQRGRDHGLPDYNTARRAYRLKTVNANNVDQIFHAKSEVKKLFTRLHNNSYHNIDVWVGGMMETLEGPGELFTEIIYDQFKRIRNGDRFWFENKNNGNGSDEIHPLCHKVVQEGYCYQTMNNGHVNRIPCFHIPKLYYPVVETCSEGGTYDYFSNSEVSFLGTFVGLICLFGVFFMILFCKIYTVHRRYIRMEPEVVKSTLDISDPINMYTATEWMDYSSPNRPAIIILDENKRQIHMKNQLGHLTRALDLNMTKKMMIFAGHGSQYLLLRVDHNYDLVLKFDSIFLRTSFLRALETFLQVVHVEREIISRITTKAVLKQAVTMKARQKRLEQFFRVVFSQAFHIAHSEEEILKIDSAVAIEVIYTELTLLEFAEALSMRPDAEFVRKIFNLVDTDKNGFISFREFIDMLVLFLKGTAEEKLKLMFDMYDINGTGQLKREEFSNMLRSFMETVNADVSDDELESVVHSMMDQAHIAQKDTIDLQDFKNILGEFNDKLSYAELEFNVNSDGMQKKLTAGKSTIRSTFIGEVKKTVESLYADPNDLKSRVEGNFELNTNNEKRNIIDKMENIIEPQQDQNFMNPITKYIANNQLQIFWIFLYTMALLGIFAERFYYYTFLNQHTGMKQVMGYGIAAARGSASAIMFAYSSMLLTMCQNIITILRDSILQFYIPFDSAIEMHKYIAVWALIFTVIHCVAHGFNFYYISNQSADDLTCLFRNTYHESHELPKFHDWFYTTLTGITSLILTIICGIIFMCSMPIVRQKIYSWFAFGHSMYPIFYVLTLLHGSGRLIQGPSFHYFLLGPATLFAIDKIFTVTRKRIAIPLIKADLLPSDVTSLIFQRPQHFKYKSGQWVRISCPALNAQAYHPFTLSSAPHEPYLSVHIRAVGPWTRNLRSKLDPTRKEFRTLPRIHVDGPYGESHQNWDKYDISIMVAGGIGVTPFASILKDIVFKCNQKFSVGCKKIYFIWVTRSQKQFEWMVDILREVEKADTNNVISAHIFITQFYEKFDLRTILLYICERHFQKVSNKSLFTGLTAVTHFGRPNFAQFFLAIQRIHNNIDTIGVFSCGSPTMTRSVDNACQSINRRADTQALFQHHYKSF